MAMLRDQRYKDSLNPTSSFLSIEKVIESIIELIMRNEKIKKLLYYTDKHALSLPPLTNEQTQALIGEAIRIVPRITIEPDHKPYIIISIDRIIPQTDQELYYKLTFSIDIICNYDHWPLPDFKLRPYVIAGEIDGMLTTALVNKGTASFIESRQLTLNKDSGGVSLFFTLDTNRST